jgi:hypothetical protein
MAIAMAGCSSDPADVAGNYELQVTNGVDGCELGLEPGANPDNISLEVTQNGESANGDINGLIADVFLTRWLGSSLFTGSVDGDHATLTRQGNISSSRDGCSYFVNAVIEADLEGDLLTGEIHYSTATNGSPDCGTLQGCETVQAFNGTRPPR